MIKNIVFDIGDVLIDFNPYKYADRIGVSSVRVNEANTILIRSEEWRKYLDGNILLEDLIQHFIGKYPEYEREFKLVLEKDDVKESIFEITENVELLKKLSKDYNIYLLSNIAKESLECISEKYNFVTYVKGGVYSYKVHVSKPNKEIYKILLNKYNITPEETIYIDDKEKNVEMARKLKMIGITYKGKSIIEEIGGILN